MISSLFVLALAICATAEPQFNVFGNGNNRPFGGGNRFQPTFSRPSTSFSRPSQPTTFSRPAPVSSGPSGPVATSGGSTVEFRGQRYVLSWREGQSDMTWDQARSFCQRKGMRMISLDSSDKVQHFFGIISSDNAPFIWAGATKSGNTLQWANGRSESIAPGRFPWSHTGIKGQPQPDGGSQETCLAVLNNVYNDGVKFHDVSCPHKKPTICEA